MSHNPAAETQVNTYTTEAQLDQQIIGLADGGWVVTWTSYGGQDGSFTGVYQQAYNADGTTRGVETQVNTYTDIEQSSQQITALADGGWVVTWQSSSQDGNNYGVYQQTYNADGTTRGVETQVNTYTSAEQWKPQITALADGGWVVTWTSYGQDGSNYGVYQQAYNADGTAQGVETQVNTYTAYFQSAPQITALADGGWVVTWVSSDQDGDYYGVYQQAYNADGTAQGVETRVNTYTAGDQYDPHITALADGGWVVTWYSDGQDGYSYGIYQQAYNADGSTQGDETQVNTYTTSNQYTPRITALADGGWVVTWYSYGQDGDNGGVFQQAYNADGTTRGVETEVNTYTAGNQIMHQITALADGGWVVTWMSDGQDGGYGGIYQQRYDVQGQIYGTNHAPTAADATLTATEDTAYTFSTADFGFSDGTDGDSLSAVIISALPASGTLKLDGVAVQAGDQIDASDIAAGKLVYVPAANANGAGLASLTFAVVDDGGTASGGVDTSTSHTITFDVTSTADAPAGASHIVSLLEDGSYTFATSNFGFSDVDGDSFSAVIITTLPASGTLTLDGVAVQAGDSIDASDIAAGKLVYVPAADANGRGLASLAFEVVDDSGIGGADTSGSYTITFDVVGVPATETQVNTYTLGSQFAQQVTALDDGGWVITWISSSQDGSSWGIYQQAYNADGTAQGDEIQVNTYVNGMQADQQVTALADGGWVVAWSSGQDGSGNGVYQQAYDKDGNPLGVETQVNTYTIGAQNVRLITAVADGGWVVTWISSGEDGDGWGVYQQSYNADGSTLGAETRVNTYTGGDQLSPEITALAHGGWVVTWISSGEDGSSYGIYQQAYDAGGNPQGAETQVNTSTAGDQTSPQITALADGGWVVTWMSSGQGDDDDHGIYQQAYNADGTTNGGEIHVNTYTTGDQTEQQVTALADGGWVVTWTSDGRDGDYLGICLQAYNADGSTLGVETQVNTYTTSWQNQPQITALADGGWVVTWVSLGQDGYNHGVYQQAYNADGSTLGDETRVNTYTAEDQQFPATAALADGGWVVTWCSYYQDGDDYGVYQQRYDADGQAYGTNNAPTASDATLTATEDTNYTFSAADFGFSDSDGDSLSAVIISTLPATGTLIVDGVTVGAGDSIDASDIAAGKLVYVPPVNANGGGLASLTFKVVDDGGTEGGGADTSGSHTLTFDVTAVDDAPTLDNNAGLTLDEGAKSAISAAQLAFDDVDNTDSEITYTIDTAAANGWLWLDADGDDEFASDEVLSAGETFTQADINDGLLHYTHIGNETTSDGFQFDVTDGDGGTVSNQSFAITVAPVNDAPTWDNSDTLTLYEGVQSAISAAQLAFDDVDNTDAEITYTLDTTTRHGTLWLDADDDGVMDSGEALTAGESFTQDDINNGLLHYTHDGGESTSDGFQFDVTDGSGGTVSDQSFAITVTPVSDAPTASDKIVSLLEDGSYTFAVANFGFSDADGDSLSKVIITALPASGTLKLNGVAVHAGDAIDPSDIAAGKLTYVPPADANGRGLANLTFEVIDDSGVGGADTSASHTITFDVVGVPAVETQVNTETASAQFNQTITALADGGWVVTWQSNGQDGIAGGIYQQVYNADGTMLGEETQVNTYTTSNQSSQQITALADGGWVVTWQSYGEDGDDEGIYQQAYNADGTTLGVETEVNTYTARYQDSQHVTALADGGWVVSWQSYGQDGDTSDLSQQLINDYGVYQQVYNADGTAQGVETQVNTYTASIQGSPQITTLADGGWVVTWQSYLQDGSGAGVYQQRYDAHGTAQGDETRVNTYTTNSQGSPQITALADGGWVVTWVSAGQDGSGYGIFQQAYNADGTAQGLETRVNTYTANDQSSQQITALADGGWVVTWVSNGQDGSGYGVYQQAYNADGTTLGVETRVNTYTANDQSSQQITALADGGWVVTWATIGQDGDSYGVYQQAYNADGTTLGVETRVNTYTASNQTSPQITALADGGWVVTWSSYGQDGSSSGVYQQRYDAEGQICGTNHAPTAADATLTTLEDTAHTFSAAEFGFADTIDGDNLSTVTITALPTSGTLKLDGVTVTAGDSINASDIAAGKLLYVPAANAHGTGLASLTFKVVDDGGTEGGGFDMSGSHTITFNVTSVSDAPTATDATLTTNEDTAYTFSATDFGFADSDGGSLDYVTITALPANGTLKLNGVAVTAGQQIDAADLSSLVWRPAANANGTGLASLTFTVSDDGGTAHGGNDTSAAHTLTFNVTSVSDAPTATDGTVTTVEDGTYVFNSSEFGFSDGTDGGTMLGVQITQLPTYGTLTNNGVAVTAGQFISLSDLWSGNFRWAPQADDNGAGLATLKFKVKDDGGTANGGADTSTEHTLTFDVTAVNDAPTGTDSTVIMDEDGSRTLTAADFNFSDTEGDGLLAIIIGSVPYRGSLTYDGVAVTAGQRILASDLDAGLLVYRPAADGYSNDNEYDSIGYWMQDDGGRDNFGNDTSLSHALTFKVTGFNDAPVSSDATVSSFENEAYTFNVGNFPFSDAEFDSLASVMITGLPTSGTLTLDGAAVTANTSISAADIVAGKLVWTPPTGASGTGLASLTFKVRDDGASGSGNVNLSDQHTLSFDVGAVSHAPTAQDATLTVLENHGLTFQLGDFGFADTDGDSLASIVIASPPASGTLKLNGVDLAAGDTVSMADIAAGKFIWTPAAGANGNGLASLTFKVQDDGGTAHGGSDTSLAHTLTFNVTSVNDAPTAQDATLTVLEDHGLTIQLSDFGFDDTDNGNFTNVYVTSLPASGTLTLNGQTVTTGTAIAAADIAAGKLVWTPAEGENGARLASLDFKVQDDGGTAHGGADTSLAHTLTFNVTAVNDAPTAQDATLTAIEDTPYTFSATDFGFSDADGDSLSAVIISALPDSGTLELYGEAVEAGTAIDASDIAAGKLLYVPAANANGTGLASLTFKVVDNGGTANGGVDTSGSHAITFDVTAADDAPTGSNQTLSLFEDGFRIIPASSFGYSDADGDGLLAVIITTLPASGALTVNGVAVEAGDTIGVSDIAGGKLVWTPAADAHGDGLASLGFKVVDGSGTESVGSNTITFNVTSLNDAPTAQDATLTVLEDHSLTIELSDFGFADADSGNFANLYITSLPAKGTLTLNGQAVTVDTAITAAESPPASSSGRRRQTAAARP